MNVHQETYIRNLKRVMSLADFTAEIPGDIPRYVRERGERNREIEQIIAENTALLREYLMPLLDDIVSAPEEEIADLEDFAAHLLHGNRQLDLLLNYIVRNALVTYARRNGRRDMLIRQLYHTGMALFYMQQIIYHADKNDYRWKMSMMFGEAASYIKKYDEIEDVETRGYIHRSMANLGLAYRWSDPEERKQKSGALRRSFQILTDPVYHEKTPDLPWDIFIYKSHQERTTAMQLLRMDEGDPRTVREVMESAEFIWKRQLENSKRKGVKPTTRWVLEYEIALYHCGVNTLSQLLQKMEQAFMDRDTGDFSENGIWDNVLLPAYYSEYLYNNPSLVPKKKDILLYMYGQVIEFVRRMPHTQLGGRLVSDLLTSFQVFHEFPDGIQAKDFLMDMVVCRDPDIYVYLQLTADVSCMIMDAAIEKEPEQLAGLLGCRSAQEVRERRKEILQFTYENALLHDVGVFLFSSLVTTAARARLEEEKKMYDYHVNAGKQILSRCRSTQQYVPTAFGHHRWYDGSAGYPEEYDRAQDPNVQVTDVVSIAAYMVGLTDAKFSEDRTEYTLEQAMARVEAQAGTRFSPVFAGLLAELREPLARFMQTGVVRAYERAFERL